MPVREWAKAFAIPATRTRLEPDTLERQRTYGQEMMQVLESLGRDGPRWRPASPPDADSSD
jgi:hypothetical protein